MPQVSQIPLVYEGLRVEETYFQVFDQLDWLAKVTEETFVRINNRVLDERSRLENLSSKVLKAQNAIGNINATRATLILSPSQFPKNGVPWEDFALIHKEEDWEAPKKHKYYGLEEEDYGHGMLSMRDIENSFSHLQAEFAGVSAEAQTKLEGLGRLPSTIPSVSSLLLFNTQDNPYNTYASLDNLEGWGTSRMKKDDESKKELTEAPKTVTDGDQLPDAVKNSVQYQPGVEKIPELNFPSTLPLPNIADLIWSQEEKIISPSAGAGDPHADLPDFDSSATITAPEPPTTEAPSAPPAPPPPAPNTAQNEAKEDEDSGEEAPAGDSGGRGGLLADIRKGRKLKAVTESTGDEDGAEGGEEKRPKMEAEPMDLMGQLMAKLQRRRKGINSDAPDKKSKTADSEDESDQSSSSIKLPENSAEKDDGEIEDDDEEAEDDENDEEDWEP